MSKCYDDFTKEELIKLLHKQDEELAIKKYGLTWDSEKEPEQVVLDCENNLPILKRVADKEIKTDDSDYNLLIEGDNYHALTVLNYTHKEKIDIIYIDPPYNTGNKDFKYNDCYVDKEDGYRHSKWLNFMDKRLRLAHNLLKDEGVIFISIDDNEQANLKLLCDKIFKEENLIATLPRITKKGGKSSDNVQKNHDYVMIYTKTNKGSLQQLEHNDSGFKYIDEYESERGKYKLNQTLDYDSLQYCPSLDYEIKLENKTFYPGSSKENYLERKKGKHQRADWAWRWSEELFEFGLKNGFIVVNHKTNRIYTKTYQNATIGTDEQGNYVVEITPRKKALASIALLENEYSNDNAKKELKNIVGKFKFDYPKPSQLIYDLVKRIKNKNAIVLDFTAGSGTTGHSVLKLNKDDGGNRHFILCTNNENNICSNVCYPRISNIINGYNENSKKKKKITGLSGNLQYYKTDLIPVERINKINDSQREELTLKAGEMIAIKENCFNQIELNDYYQIFENNTSTKRTAIYFREDVSDFDELINKISDTKTILYIFSYGRIDKKIYSYLKDNITIEDIPEPILEIYKEINLTLRD